MKGGGASFTLTGVHGRGMCHTPLVAYAQRLPTRVALERAMLGDTIDADEAVRTGLANRAVDATEWRQSVDGLASRLAAGYNRNSADGKRALYRQAAAAAPGTRYEIATEAMVEMFASPAWQGHMGRFLDRRKKKPPPAE